MNSTLSYLFSLQQFGMKLGLRNIRLLLKASGNPHKNIPFIHVAGTNGKGSTAAMIAAILTAGGYKVGLYTSPHLIRFNERIRINGKMIPDHDVTRYTTRIQSEIQRVRATFFETTTAIALKYFSDQRVDIAVLETGLGGRLDATNVVKPMVAIITSVGLEHTQQLGDTIAKIAGEKAGIIKRKVPVVLGKLKRSARTVVLAQAKRLNCRIIESSNTSMPDHAQLDLGGSFQRENALCAVAAVQTIQRYFPVTAKAILAGLKRTSLLTGIHGRYETYSAAPKVLVDVAHNPHAMRKLVHELRQGEKGKITVVFGIMKDKDVLSVLRQIKKLKARIIVTQPLVKRAATTSELFRKAASVGIRAIKVPDVQIALQYAKKITPKAGTVVVCGSHYLVGEALPSIRKSSRRKSV